MLENLGFRDDGAPVGFQLLHSAANVAEAELLRQVLAEAGFHIEHIASTGTGVFGTVGSPSIYVLNDEFVEAGEFLKEWWEFQSARIANPEQEYLNAETEGNPTSAE